MTELQVAPVLGEDGYMEECFRQVDGGQKVSRWSAAAIDCQVSILNLRRVRKRLSHLDPVLPVRRCSSLGQGKRWNKLPLWALGTGSMALIVSRWLMAASIL